jgi:DNA polymerase III epsilon subunit-like protein
MDNFFGIEITLEHPAAEARAELGELKTALQEIESALALTPDPSPAGGEAAALLALDPLFVDYETTGLNRRTDRVCEVTVIDRQGRVLLSTLVNPQMAISPAAGAVNGITDELVADAPTWRQVEPALRQLLAGRVVVAHNAPFEAKFTPFAANWVCSMALADRALGKAEWGAVKQDWRAGSSLRARLYQCRLPQAEAHTAAGDCLGALRLVRFLAGVSGEVELIY